MQQWNLAAIETAFADAAIDPTRWSQALESLTRITESFGAIQFPLTGGPDFQMPFTEQMIPSFEAYFRDSWDQRDERFKGAPAIIAKGIVDDLDIMSLEAIDRHCYYQEFLAPFGLKWFAGLRVAVGDDIWAVSLQRSSKQGPFSPQDKQRLLGLTQSISSSAAIAQAIGFGAAKGTLDAFESTSKAAVLVNRSGEAVRMNASAEALLCDELKVVARQLVGVDRVATNALKTAINNLVVNRPASVPLPVIFPRTFRRPILAYPLRLERSASYFFANCALVIIFVDLEQPLQTPEIPLRNIFHMTQSEARLAARLMSGDKLETIACELGISKETGRRHLKAIFGKAGVNRQSELVALLARLPRSDNQR